jgi:hypothetical protein
MYLYPSTSSIRYIQTSRTCRHADMQAAGMQAFRHADMKACRHAGRMQSGAFLDPCWLVECMKLANEMIKCCKEAVAWASQANIFLIYYRKTVGRNIILLY